MFCHFHIGTDWDWNLFRYYAVETCKYVISVLYNYTLLNFQDTSNIRVATGSKDRVVISRAGLDLCFIVYDMLAYVIIWVVKSTVLITLVFVVSMYVGRILR